MHRPARLVAMPQAGHKGQPESRALLEHAARPGRQERAEVPAPQERKGSRELKVWAGQAQQPARKGRRERMAATEAVPAVWSVAPGAVARAARRVRALVAAAARAATPVPLAREPPAAPQGAQAAAADNLGKADRERPAELWDPAEEPGLETAAAVDRVGPHISRASQVRARSFHSAIRSPSV